MKATTVNSQHFEKRSKSKREGMNTHNTKRRGKLAERQDDNSIDGTIDWATDSGDWRRCETMWLTWAGGHGPFNINATSYPDNIMAIGNGDIQGALQWQIAYLVGNHNYQWVARAPPNTTFFFDVEDTSNGQRISSYLPIHINNAFAAGLTSCQVDYSTASNTTLIIDGSDTQSTSTTSINNSLPSSSVAVTVMTTQSSSTSSYSGTNIQQGDNSSSSQSSISDKTVKSLHAGIAILIIALLVMGFLQYRLRKRLNRLQKGHSTVGKWMNHHNHGFGKGGMKEKTVNETQDSVGSSRENSQDTRPFSSQSDLYANSEAGSSTNFFAHRSASPLGHGASSIARAASTTSTTRFRPPSISSSSTRNPFADKADDDDEDIIHRSASQAKRYSQAESTISESNTATTSTSGRLSSIAPSDQVSSVGNASVVSDDHYHRAKAFTISRGVGLSGVSTMNGGQFLDPNFSFLDSRR